MAIPRIFTLCSTPILILAAVSLITPAAYATDSAAEGSGETKMQADEKTQDLIKKKREEIIHEATIAVRETQDALSLLDDGETREALAALERATGKLEIILAREPKLALAPSGLEIEVLDVIADVEQIKERVEDAEDLLEEGQLQKARHLISGLASEIVISVSHIPLATYPDAVKAAARLIDEGKVRAAQHALQAMLNTLVVTDYIVSLPVIAAQTFLEQADKLAQKTDRPPADNARLANLLEQARRELKFAQALGYGTEEEFKELYGQLEEIEQKSSGGKSGGFFDKIKSAITRLLESGQAEIQQQAEQKGG
jgi:S-adenosylmethionine/arginine decarboxylase-like enzyme/ElaB/YqjD/DUF883 family membrane-anchored ribosome-binding protein